MAKALEYMIQAEDGSEYYRLRYVNFVRYGRCPQPPYIQNDLWFVTIVSSEREGPKEDLTFLIDKQYAHPSVIQEWKRDISKWGKIAHKVFKGVWCERYECLWKDVSVYEHTLPNGNVVKYGYCRTQPKRSDRELWYVTSRDSTFVVDSVCATPDFINRMNDDTFKWMIICWCHLQDEVAWDKLQTGTLEGGYVRSHNFALASPFTPDSLDDIKERLRNYEIVVGVYTKQRKGTEPEWNSLSMHSKQHLLEHIGRQVIGKSAMPTRSY